MSAFKVSRMWWFGYAVLLRMLALHVTTSRAYRLCHTRHTILLHFLHSPTMSRAQGPTLPLVKRRDACFVGYMLGLPWPWGSVSNSAADTGDSFMQRNVSVFSMVRYCSRFARNWRQVRDRSCSVFKSSRLANCETMLRSSVSSGV